MRESEKAIEGEETVRQSRENNLPCPFAKMVLSEHICTRIDIRCGERKQFSEEFKAEDENLRKKNHLCLREIKRVLKESRVLVVDDDDTLRELCTEFLRSMDILECFQANKGSEAEFILENQKRKGLPIDLVITDIEMGKEEDSGYALATFVDYRNHPSFIILMSGKVDTNRFQLAHPLIKHRICKPFNMEKFTSVVASTLQPEDEEKI